MQIKLTIESGHLKGQVYTFREPQGFTFGRAVDCSFVVENDNTFSRHHFLMEINPPQVWIKDLGSLNGTYVNEKIIGSRPAGVEAKDAEHGDVHPLRDGDIIKAGTYTLRLKVDASVLCVDCGKKIPEKEKKKAEFVGGTYLCTECRQKARKKKNDKVAKADNQRLNPEQRERAEEQPGLIIDEILKQFIHDDQNEKKEEIMGYQLEKKIGEGGFGAVYTAIRQSDGKRVAIKTILQTRKPEERQKLMFEREKEISVALRHPNIVHCENADLWNDIHFIEMEYMPGGCVAKLLRKKGKLQIDYAIHIMLQALEGLSYAHNANLELSFEDGSKTVKGVVHRDLKPANILLSDTSSSPVVKISDFGLAKAFSEAGITRGGITSPGMMMGSLPYMAPEHLINYRYLKPATDVFEIAASFFHILTGEFIWDFKKGRDPYRVLLQEKPRMLSTYSTETPVELSEVIDRALELKPENRYLNGEEFLKAMKNAI